MDAIDRAYYFDPAEMPASEIDYYRELHAMEAKAKASIDPFPAAELTALLRAERFKAGDCPRCGSEDHADCAEPVSQCCGWPIDEDSRCLKCHQRTGELANG